MPGVRRWRRFQFKWPVQIKSSSNGQSDSIELTNLENLSCRGAFFYCQTALQLNDWLDVLIGLPSQPEVWMKYAARVVRVEPLPGKFSVPVIFRLPAPNS